MKNFPIGILDSGVGGLTIWREIVKELPNESTIYVGDNANCPYGSRSEQEIYKLARRLVKFLLKHNCKLIVVACNTITVSCLDKLRADFPDVPIVGTVPVIKTASERSKNKKIGILSTVRTAESRYQKNLIERFAGECKVINVGTDKLVPLIERGKINSSIIRIIEQELKAFIESEVDVLALGCSHFPFLKEQMHKILGSNVTILDSGAAIARQVRRILESNDILSEKKLATHELFTTGDKVQFVGLVKKYYSSEVENLNFLIRPAALLEE